MSLLQSVSLHSSFTWYNNIKYSKKDYTVFPSVNLISWRGWNNKLSWPNLRIMDSLKKTKKTLHQYNTPSPESSKGLPRRCESWLTYWLSIVGRGTSVGIATRCGLDRPGIGSRWGARFSTSVQTVPGTNPASCTMGTESFPVVKRPRRAEHHPTTSSTEIKERVELYLYSHSRPSWSGIGRT